MFKFSSNNCQDSGAYLLPLPGGHFDPDWPERMVLALLSGLAALMLALAVVVDPELISSALVAVDVRSVASAVLGVVIVTLERRQKRQARREDKASSSRSRSGVLRRQD